MRRSFYLVVLLLGFTAAPLHAQWGGLIDKLQKLSGPRMWYNGFTLRYGYQPGQTLEPDRLNSIEDRFDTLSERRGALVGDTRRIAGAAVCVDSLSAVAARMNALGYDEKTIDRVRADLRRIDRRLDRLNRSLTGLRDPAINDSIESLAVASCALDRTLGAVTSDVAQSDPGSGLVWRLGLYVGHDLDNDAAAGAIPNRPEDIYALLIKPTVEYRFAIPAITSFGGPLSLGVEVGISAHYFHGDITPFWHATYPVLINVHPFARCESWLLRNIRGGGGFHVVPRFEPDAFAPVPGYQVEGGEIALTWFVGLDISLSSAPPLQPLKC